MHERISMLLFRRIGAPAPREAHARLFVNNTYAGLFTIVESVDKTVPAERQRRGRWLLFKYDYNTNDRPWYFDDRAPIRGCTCRCRSSPKRTRTIRRPEAFAELVRIVNHDSDAVVPEDRRAVHGFRDVPHGTSRSRSSWPTSTDSTAHRG